MHMNAIVKMVGMEMTVMKISIVKLSNRVRMEQHALM